MTVRRPHTKFTGLSAEQVAERLGVKKETVYAYVSRGLLTRDRPPGSRVSRFDPDEVDRLAARHRHGGRAGAMEIVVDSKLTYLDPAGHFYYRGWDAVQASETASFEQVAAWLWGMHGAPDPKHETLFWPDGLLVSYAVAAARALPAEATPVDRYLAALAAAAAADPYRPNRDAYAVSVRGARLIT
ncbi:MAG: helix-turn-helix domain-containing protein, partial [Acidimicrobiales bacterium]